MENKLTKAQAKKYSLIKWDHARKTGCTDKELIVWIGDKHPKIYVLKSVCGYCHKYRFSHFCSTINCERCPLSKLWGSYCTKGNSIYDKWIKAAQFTATKTRKKYAEQIYQDIKRS